VRRINVDNMPLTRFIMKIKCYSDPVISLLTGYAHQYLYRSRVTKKYAGVVPGEDLQIPITRLI
jgi:hypothetical protein